MPPPDDAARALGAGLVQPDQRTCGSSVLVVVRALEDPAYATFLVHGEEALTDGRPAGSVQDRFGAEALAMHRRTNAWRDTRGHLQLPWPQALGTLPWAVARQTGAVTGTTYGARLVLPHQRARAFDGVRATVSARLPVPLFVGNRLSARHVVLAFEPAPAGVSIYDPARGTCYVVTRDAFVLGRLDVAGWRVPWFVVVPW